MERSVEGGIECPPSEIKQNEGTETCEGSKWGFLSMPNTSRLFPDGYYVYFMCLHMSAPLSEK